MHSSIASEGYGEGEQNYKLISYESSFYFDLYPHPSIPSSSYIETCNTNYSTSYSSLICQSKQSTSQYSLYYVNPTCAHQMTQRLLHPRSAGILGFTLVPSRHHDPMANLFMFHGHLMQRCPQL